MKVPSMYDKRRCVLNLVCHFPAEWAVDGPWGGGLCGKHSLSMHWCQVSATVRVATGDQHHL